MWKINQKPVVDDRIEKVRDVLKLSEKDVLSSWRAFRRLDKEGCGLVYTGNFFRTLGEEPTLFTTAIFDITETKDRYQVDFGEFIHSVCTYAAFQYKEMVRFVFFILDKDKNGYVDREELINFIGIMHGGRINSNAATAIGTLPHSIKGKTKNSLDSVPLDEDEMIDYDEFFAICKQFPSILHPAFRLQGRMRSYVMGERWWTKKLDGLQRNRSCFADRSEKKRALEEKRLLKERRQTIISELGFYNFYFNKHRRECMERIYPKPKVYLNNDYDIQVDFPQTDFEGED